MSDLRGLPALAAPGLAATVAGGLVCVLSCLGGAEASSLVAQDEDSQSDLPSGPWVFGDFVVRFDSARTFTLEGVGWPSLGGTWEAADGELRLVSTPDPGGCAEAGTYRYAVERGRLRFELVSDACVPRQMILGGSTWQSEGEPAVLNERVFVRTSGNAAALPVATTSDGSWPSFRGPEASGVAEDQDLPDQWNSENILWQIPVPGLGHSSPIVWGSQVFVASAISSDPDATFRPGLYGDGDASADRSVHRWMLYAIDKHTGEILWERLAYEGRPVDARHIKSTYASATPATNGQVVVAWFGSQGIFAYDVEGNFLWKVDLGRMDVGAYDIPTFEWGPASSPVIWNDLVILQSDTQADSFIVALDIETGETVWRTPRDELPSWGTPTVAMTSAGPELVTNASNFIRGYDPRTGEERWRLGGSSKITAPTPVFANDLFIVSSGRAPEAPIFAVREGARGEITLSDGSTGNDAVAWSYTRRGPYMPTPLVYRDMVYVLQNNGIFDAYDLETGEEIYRHRLAHLGSGFSASPVAADGKIYIAGEDGEILIVAAGPEPNHIATNSMGDLLMATPALSEGVMYVRSATRLFAVGRVE